MAILQQNFIPFDEPVYVSRPILPPLDSVVEKLKDIWNSRWLTNGGAQSVGLEQLLKTELKVPNVSLFNNGTVALLAACNSLKLKGEVITTPFTFPATPHAISLSGLTPVFCDIDPATMNIDAGQIESLITSRTSAILAVHVFGTPCAVEKLQQIADNHGLALIYDAAHAFGVEVNGTPIAMFGDLTMFSFHATKLFHTAEGGALTYRNEAFKQSIELFRNFGIKNEEEVVSPGLNGKMNELQAALGLVVFESLEQERKKRQLLYDIYCSELLDVPGLIIHATGPDVRSSLQYFALRIDKSVFGLSRDELYCELKKYNVFTRKYFYPLCSDFECYRDLPSARPENLPVASTVAQQVLCLPFYGDLQPEQVITICGLIKALRLTVALSY